MSESKQLSAMQEGALRGRFLAARKVSGGRFSQEKMQDEDAAWQAFLAQPLIQSLLRKQKNS